MQNNKLVQYYRSRNGQPRGCVVALKTPQGKVQLGWSLCCKRDVFKKKWAVELATRRALKDAWGLPPSLMDTFKSMQARAVKYFK